MITRSRAFASASYNSRSIIDSLRVRGASEGTPYLEGTATVSSFYDILGLETPELADEKGWSLRNMNPILELEWDAKVSNSGKMYLTLRYNTTTLW